ncbi:membrane protein [Streptomyces sodiiphilus]|uniref:Membrane protein n=1 Tax=Streptomyces sodiiphilus TaxID=226217 RepID=A0ABN2NQT9_9ACTN
MNQAARRIGRSLALVLPVVLVLSGTLAVTQVPWASSEAGAHPVLAAAAEHSEETAAQEAEPPAPQDLLLARLTDLLYEEDPGAALTALQEAVHRMPSLAPHCEELARELGRAAVTKYGSAHRAQQHARPVCDTSFAAGVADAR